VKLERRRPIEPGHLQETGSPPPAATTPATKTTPTHPSSSLATLLERVGLRQDVGSAARQVGRNIRSFVEEVKTRERKFVRRVIDTVAALGLTAVKATTLDDLRQLWSFAQVAVAAGQGGQVFAIAKDIVSFVLTHPEEARRILGFIDQATPAIWKQKSAWMEPGGAAAATAARSVAEAGDGKRVPEYDVVVIGAGLSASSFVRELLARLDGSRPLRILMIDRDTAEARTRAASFRNAGMICTVLDYVFGLEEAIGKQPVEEIARALKISTDEARDVYAGLTRVLQNANQRISQFLGDKNPKAGYSQAGSIEVATSSDEMQKFRRLASEAAALGYDWNVLDRDALSGAFGITSDEVVGGIHFREWGLVHPGRFVQALFDHIQVSPQVQVQWQTEFTDAEPVKDGEGWLLRTSEGPLRATQVIDAREGFAPYSWREARYSQVHVLDLPRDSRPLALGKTSLNHGLSYMRRLDDTKLLVGSGDFKLGRGQAAPAPLASIALYAAACFKKLYPETPFNIERVWGGVFGISKDGLPVVGELAHGWYVIGGAGGTGLSLCPAMAEQTADVLMGRATGRNFGWPALFSPRRFFMLSLREELGARLAELPGFKGIEVEQVRIDVLERDLGPLPFTPTLRAGHIVFRIGEDTLDTMNSDLLAFLRGSPSDNANQRARTRLEWIGWQLQAAAKLAPPG
jgi:glycine/D-amino acid oxidase-like deaminating enzyme